MTNYEPLREATEADELDRPVDASPDPVETEEAPPTTGLDVVAGAMALIEETELHLGDVEAALERIESGQYRTCEICGSPIDAAVLATSPTLRRCLVHRD